MLGKIVFILVNGLFFKKAFSLSPSDISNSIENYSSSHYRSSIEDRSSSDCDSSFDGGDFGNGGDW